METYSLYNISIIGIIAFGSIFAGYGLAVIGTTLGQPTWYASMSLEAIATNPGYAHTSTIIGAANGVFFAGGFFGTFISGYTADRFGRVIGFRIAAVIGIIGATIQTASVNQGMFLFARVVTGLASGHCIAAMPTYYAEVAPPHSRGLMTGAHASLINTAYAISGWIGFGCYFYPQSSFGWRFPNGVLILWGICLLVGTFFVPESPRWLVEHGQDETALAILCRLHHDPNDSEDHFAHRELNLIKGQLEFDQAAMQADGKWQLLTKKTYRIRLILATVIMSGGQNVGVLVINNYSYALYTSLGLSPTKALLVGSCWNTVAMIFNYVGAFASDRLGRRRALLSGYVSSVAFFIIMTALIAKYSDTGSSKYAGPAVAFIFLYVVVYGSLIDVNQFTVATEIFPSHLRSQGSCIAISSLFLADVLWLELAPTAQAKIGWKFYLLFIFLGTLTGIYLYFKLPETSGLALEEIDGLFGKEVSGHIADENGEKAVTTQQAE